MGKIYHTEEEIVRRHKRYRVCKNKGNDCEKEEFMAKHASAKFCSERCSNTFSNREKKEFKEGNSTPRNANILKLRSLMQDRNTISFTCKEIDDFGINLHQFDHIYLDDRRKNSYGIWIGEFNITMRESNEIVIRTKIYNDDK